MFVDFGMAAHCEGRCYLRFDDTNPEAEKMEYIDHIQEIVSWMGWKPWKVTSHEDGLCCCQPLTCCPPQPHGTAVGI